MNTDEKQKVAHFVKHGVQGCSLCEEGMRLSVQQRRTHPIYVVDPNRSGAPLRFDTEAEAQTYLVANPSAASVPASQVAREHR